MSSSNIFTTSTCSLVLVIVFSWLSVCCYGNLTVHSYLQTLDHFTYRPDSYVTFRQKYLMSDLYWGGNGAPMLVYLGGEAGLNSPDIETSMGFLSDHAPQLRALTVFIEHRYYGDSMPFGDGDEAFQNATTLGYLNSAQALADYAEVIISLKRNLSAELSPVIVVGGSYAGMLAACFRLKYPHVAHGALASSAPIRLLLDTAPKHGFDWVVSEDFRKASKNCYDVIRKSWVEIDRIAAQPDGLAALSRQFNKKQREKIILAALPSTRTNSITLFDGWHWQYLLCELVQIIEPIAAGVGGRQKRG